MSICPKGCDNLINMILKINHLFNIIFILPLLYIVGRGLQHLFLDKKKKRPKVDFDDLVKQKEQLLMLTLSKNPVNETCPTFLAYKEFDSPERDKILQVFKELQWGEGPFQREAIVWIQKEYGINCDLLVVTNSFKFLIKHELLISGDNLPGFGEILKLTSLVALYKSLMSSKHLINFAKKKNIKAEALKKALVFQINQGDDKKLKPKDFEKGLIILIKKGHDILRELILYTKVVDKLSVIHPLKSDKDLKGALRIMGLKESSSKEEIKRRYRDLALAQHPDTLSDVDVPVNLVNQASENFNQINLAYRLLLKNFS